MNRFQVLLESLEPHEKLAAAIALALLGASVGHTVGSLLRGVYGFATLFATKPTSTITDRPTPAAKPAKSPMEDMAVLVDAVGERFPDATTEEVGKLIGQMCAIAEKRCLESQPRELHLL